MTNAKALLRKYCNRLILKTFPKYPIFCNRLIYMTFYNIYATTPNANHNPLKNNQSMMNFVNGGNGQHRE